VCRCVEDASEEVDWGQGVKLVDEEEQEVVLTLSLLLEWSILGLDGKFGSRYQNFVLSTGLGMLAPSFMSHDL